jgi:hypothetical protein
VKTFTPELLNELAQRCGGEFREFPVIREAVPCILKIPSQPDDPAPPSSDGMLWYGNSYRLNRPDTEFLQQLAYKGHYLVMKDRYPNIIT